MKPPAVYLRCHAYDPSGMAQQQDILCRFAHRLGLLPPVVYLDNGCTCEGSRPGLEKLAQAIIADEHYVVLIPGRWVFSTDDRQAHKTMKMLSLAGCRRILQLPPHPMLRTA